jgi:hypothetical protein
MGHIGLRQHIGVFTILACVGLLGLTACDDSDEDGDRITAASFLVHNHSGMTVRVVAFPHGLSLPLTSGSITSIADSGDLAILPSDILTCVSILDSTGTTVYLVQQPIDDDAWRLDVQTDDVHSYIFDVSPAMLDLEGVGSACAE